MALVALAEMPEADAEGAPPLDLDKHLARKMTETILNLLHLYFGTPTPIPAEFQKHQSRFLRILFPENSFAKPSPPNWY